MDTTNQLGRRERKKIQTRRALLNHARTLVAERGLGAVRVEDITARADLAKGVFYNYFHSKEDLIAELVREGMDEFFETFFFPFPSEPDISARVRHVSQSHRRYFDKHPEYRLLFHQARGLIGKRNDRSEKLSAVFRMYLERLAEGLFPDPDTVDRPLYLAAAIGGAISGSISFLTSAGLADEGDIVEDILSIGVQPFFKP